MVVGPAESVKPFFRRMLLLLLAAFLLLNYLAYRHARSFFFYTGGTERTPSPESLGWAEKARVLIRGVQVPKPKMHSSPADYELPWESISVPGRASTGLSGWLIPKPDASELMILFHGYNSEKSGLLPEAKLFYAMGYEVLMIDFSGHGDSPGNTTTLGIREADDVVSTLAWARKKWPGRRIYLYGHSMGGAAILRAMGTLNAKPDAVIVESVFDTLLNAIRFRFDLLSVPSFPAAEILLYWGSRQLSVNGFRHDLRSYARNIILPVLVSHGTADRRASLAGARDVYDALGGKKYFLTMDGAGHVNPSNMDPVLWSEQVRRFLRDVSTGTFGR